VTGKNFKRTTHAEMEVRIHVVFEIILEGVHLHDADFEWFHDFSWAGTLFQLDESCLEHLKRGGAGAAPHPPLIVGALAHGDVESQPPVFGRIHIERSEGDSPFSRPQTGGVHLGGMKNAPGGSLGGVRVRGRFLRTVEMPGGIPAIHQDGRADPGGVFADGNFHCIVAAPGIAGAYFLKADSGLPSRLNEGGYIVVCPWYWYI